MLNAVRCCAPRVYACTLRTCSKLAKNRQRILFLIFCEIWRVKNDKYRLGKKYANAERSHRFHSAEIYSHRFHRFTQIVRVRSVSHRIHRSMVQKKSRRFHSAEMFSHRFHRFTQIVWARSVSHRISQMYGAKKSHRFHSAEMFSHRFHRFTQIVRVRSVSHRIHRIHRSMVQKNPTDFTLLRCSPTDFTDLHRLSGCVVFPTEFTEFTDVWCKKNPTDFTEHAEVLA